MKYRAAIWSFLKRTPIVFHFAWHGPFEKEKKSAIDKNVSLKQEFYNPLCIQDVRLKNILQSKCNFYSCGNAYLIIGSRCNWGQCCCVFIRFTLWTFMINVRFISYLKCFKWCRILKLVSNFECLFTFGYLDEANSIKTYLHICNLWTGQFVSYKSVI